MEKVLLTGSNGFTGRYVKKELQRQGYEVIGLVRENAIDGEIVCDITNKFDVKRCLDIVRPDYIIHLAALSFVGHSEQKSFYDVNVFGTLYFLEAVHELLLPIKKIILSSSANVYGTPKVSGLVQESAQPSPVNHYAMSKLAMEHMSKLWFEELPIVITRPFNYTGPGQDDKFLIPKIINHFRLGKKSIELGNIDVYRDFSDVRDIAKAYVKILTSDLRSDVINLCSGKVYSLEEIISKIEGIAGYQIDVKVNQNFVRANEIKILCGDNSKLNRLVEFSPSIEIEKTLSDMFLSK
ncbi:Nucleoside-diphosphate-sugar epimerase [Ferrimonas sediminum]|uniref:Nucleoside-diphosphate-sugar epimerase n=1 Tax=Ferrimonas sediminum TaxID=718193 RepID=A0A1G8Z1U5_9GAMM|nr:GDP-mannose 4,6-dehydratase [Ferrimonas sediminum]SDK08604.1 Nucleoside-diphosphate-sugar epimerase [Ferrimonas sediminum]